MLYILKCGAIPQKNKNPFEQFKDSYISSLLTKGTNLKI